MPISAIDASVGRSDQDKEAVADVTAKTHTEKAATVLGVDYVHVQLPDGGDLYLTRYGVPWRENLMPDKFWTDREWFAANSSKLFGHEHRSGGSGTIYRVRTKPVNGRSKDIVMKWNRMAQEVPGARDHDELLTAEFSSPFEEFALLMEMREAWRDLDAKRVLTHKPLAIYAPTERVDPWRIGRKEDRMRHLIRAHSEVKLDLFRQYAVIYEWIKGLDLQAAYRENIVSKDEMAELTLAVDQDLSRLGFAVRDRKPPHIICRVDEEKKALVAKNRRLTYGLVDFELLERTPEREALERACRRQRYLQRQTHRFEVPRHPNAPSHLCGMTVMDVDYVVGPAESTGGRLWVVGRDPLLFDYFLPERWEHTPKTRLSATDEVYETVTKDNIHIVWKLSHVGEHPEADPFKPDERRILEHGFNSPFEEISLAIEIQSKGLLSTMPRAIYETHHPSSGTTLFGDESRYTRHDALTVQGGPILRHDRDYIVIWGYWNKPDESLAEEDGDYYEPVDALRALHTGLLSRAEYMALMQTTKERLARIGIEDLSFGGHHKLLSLDASGNLVKDASGMTEVRICNFELMKRM